MQGKRRLFFSLLLIEILLRAAYCAEGIETYLQIGAQGLPLQIRATGLKRELFLVGPMSLSWEENNKLLPLPAFQAIGPGAYSLSSPPAALALTIHYGREIYPHMELELANLAAEARKIMLQIHLPCRPEAQEVFFPAVSQAREPIKIGDKPRHYGYGYGGIVTAMPLGQIYSRAHNWGLAFFEELGLLVEPWRVTLAKDEKATTISICWPVSVGPGERARRRIYFAATEGDWRPALGAILTQFPHAFTPVHPEAIALDGPFFCSGGTPPDSQISEWRRQGCKVVEVHCTMPFYGEYVPQNEPWTPLVDDRWHMLKTRLRPEERPEERDWRGIIAAVQKQYPPDMTIAKINDYVERLHAHGLKGLIYFNPTEAWQPWALEHFAEDVMYDANGKPRPAWLESCCMIPDIRRAWGKYILEQLQAELRAYPHIDGVFFDQSAGGGHELTLLCYEGTKLVRARGGLCWWNGPYNMELAALADGMMTEGGGSERYRTFTEIIQYYGLAGKPIVSLGPAAPASYAEMLSRGVQPQPVVAYLEPLRQRWAPLFRWLRGRRWILEAHALADVLGFEANIYRVSEGNNIVITLVPQNVGAIEPQIAYNVPVTVQLSEANEIKGAYLLSPDWQGYHKLNLRKKNKTLSFSVPRLHWGALIVLARSGVFAALEGPMYVVAGEATQRRFVVDNWQNMPVEAQLRFTLGAQKIHWQKHIKPGESAFVMLPIPRSPLSQEATITRKTADVTFTPVPAVAWRVAGKLSAGELSPVYELPLEPPLIVWMTAPVRVRDNEAATIAIHWLSHLPQKQPVHLDLHCPLLEALPPPIAQKLTRLATAPHSVQHYSLLLKPVRAGEEDIIVTASSGKFTRRIAQPLQVVATAISPQGMQNIQAAWLELEVFGSDGGFYGHKPVSLNGIVIGNLPSGGGDSWQNCSLPLPAEAIHALQEKNEIVIENKVADCFKVRNVRLLLMLRGGIQAISQTDTNVYTGSQGWLFGEGKEFSAGKPLTGIRADIRIDPRRQETYTWAFGTPAQGKLILEAAGVDGGIYAHKPVSINGIIVGDLPLTTADSWTEISLALSKEALSHLQYKNIVKIENSLPEDAFKIRRARIEIINTEGKIWRSQTDEMSYTSCNWEFAEGKIGSPIVLELSFARE